MAQGHRIANGDQAEMTQAEPKPDTNIAGYAQLIADRLAKGEKE